MKRAIIVQGAPGVGKTTLARRLASDLGIKLIVKDDIKELLFATLGQPADKTESEAYGRSAIRAMYCAMDEFLKAGQQVMIEAPLLPAYAVGDIEPIVPLSEVLQLHVYCDPVVHEQRFLSRVASGERHIGHGDTVIDPLATQERNSAIMGVATIPVDTTNFTDIDYHRLLEQIQHVMQGERI